MASKSAEVEVMLDILSAPEPRLLIVSISSLKEPRQTSPKKPLSAIAVATSANATLSLKKNGSIETATGVTPSLPSSVCVAQLTLRW